MFSISHNDVFKKIFGRIKIKKIVSFDVETCNDNQDFVLGDVFDGVKHFTFFNKSDMKKFLLNSGLKNTFFVATNLGFDFTVLFSYAELYKFHIIQNGSRIIAIIDKSCLDDSDKNVFIDSLNFVSLSVNDIGKLLSIPKMDKPKFIGRKPSMSDNAVSVDSDGFETVHNISEFEYLKIYCQRDTVITFKIMELLQDGFNGLGGNIQLTISSTAKDIFQRSFIPKTMIKEDCFLPINPKNIILDSYYGGRTEVFSRGLILNGKVYDVNSLYPSEMCKEFPLPQSVKMVKDHNFRSIIEYEGVSKVDIVCPPDLNIPLLPFRDLKLKKLIFPIGKFSGCYTHVELRKALELGYKILKFHYSFFYRKVFYPFKDYVDEIYGLRNDFKHLGDPREIVMKLCLNSLYGKLGQKSANSIKFFNIQEMSASDIDKFVNVSNTQMFGDVGYYNIPYECNSNFVFPVIPAYVTAYGRCDMYDYILKYKGFYTDTDSVMTKFSMPTSSKLGDMKLEYEFRKAIVVKPKMYFLDSSIGNIVKVKGVPKTDIVTFDNILDGVDVSYSKFTKLKEAFRRRLMVNSVLNVDKSINLEDNKRVWKFSFSPFVLDSFSRPHSL